MSVENKPGMWVAVADRDPDRAKTNRACIVEIDRNGDRVERFYDQDPDTAAAIVAAHNSVVRPLLATSSQAERFVTGLENLLGMYRDVR